MIKTKQDLIIKIHLIISVVIVVPTAFVYGFQPDIKFDLHPETIDELNLLKAIMGLYLGFSALWIIGIFKAYYLNIAIITNMIFMMVMGAGRVLSILLDGIPTFGYVFGAFAELFLGCYALWVLKRYDFIKIM